MKIGEPAKITVPALQRSQKYHRCHSTLQAELDQLSRDSKFYEVTIDPNRTLFLQKSNRVGNAKFWWNAQKQMNIIRHRMAVQKFDFLLSTQLPENLPDLRPKTFIEFSPPILWYNHYMKFTVPLHMGLTTSVLRFGSSCTPRGLPAGGSFYTPETAEPNEGSPAELVVYEHE